MYPPNTVSVRETPDPPPKKRRWFWRTEFRCLLLLSALMFLFWTVVQVILVSLITRRKR